MKAIAYHDYGGIERMAIEEVADPGAPGTGDVRVRVIAASVNPVDGKVRRGELKLIAGSKFPKRPGLDFSGFVDAVGDGVTGFAPGDAVYGAARSMSDGAMAEHAIVHAKAIAPKPAGLDHATVAGVPTVAIAALQALRDIVKAKAGDRVLVNGATGGVGLFALQLSRQMGVDATAVCSTGGVTLARDYGAAEIVDYRQTDVRTLGANFDAILELSGKLGFDAAQPLLADHGIYVDFSPTPAALIGNAIANPFRGRKHAFAMTAAKTSDLLWIAEALDAGALHAAPTEVFNFADFAAAFAHAERGGAPGKTVVRIAAD